jgi:hypothetical protein
MVVLGLLLWELLGLGMVGAMGAAAPEAGVTDETVAPAPTSENADISQGDEGEKAVKAGLSGRKAAEESKAVQDDGEATADEVVVVTPSNSGSAATDDDHGPAAQGDEGDVANDAGAVRPGSESADGVPRPSGSTGTTPDLVQILDLVKQSNPGQ